MPDKSASISTVIGCPATQVVIPPAGCFTVVTAVNSLAVQLSAPCPVRVLKRKPVQVVSRVAVLVAVICACAAAHIANTEKANDKTKTQRVKACWRECDCALIEIPIVTPCERATPRARTFSVRTISTRQVLVKLNCG
ncbi:hypothetical protein [Rudaea sp.]|uniref:hypothetical protein n=1 Tax=Rudaea sp. TaxID=2136325 RepID=UPI002ED28381